MSIQDSDSRINVENGTKVLWQVTGALAVMAGTFQVVFAIWWSLIGYPQIENLIWAAISLIAIAGGVLAFRQIRSIAPWLILLSAAQARIDREFSASNRKEIVMSINDGVAAGWYVDPSGLPTDRYWDGTTWTDQTRPRVSGLSGAHGGSAAVGPSRNGMGTAALTLGILGIFLGWLFSFLAIIFGSIGIARANRGEATNKSAATWGLWLGIVAPVFWIFVVFVVLGSSS